MRTRRLIAASAAALALSSGLAVTAHAGSPGASGSSGLAGAGAEGRANDTPDGHYETIDAPGEVYGWVYWNDYKDSDHSVDIDDFAVQDDWGDGVSIQLRVYWKGKTYKAHAYNGETKTIGIGDVPNNKKVYWRACGWDNGGVVDCTKKNWFKE